MAREPSVADRSNTITEKEMLVAYRDLIATEKNIARLTAELASERGIKAGIFRRAKKAGADTDALKNVIRLAKMDDEDRNRLRENEERYANWLNIPLWRAGLEGGRQVSMFDPPGDDPETLAARQDMETAQSNQEGYNARYDDKEFDANPYEKGTTRAQGWNQGWKHADDEIETRKKADGGNAAKPKVQKAQATRKGKAGGAKGAPPGATVN